MLEKMPTDYLICLNSACPHAENCLRQMCAMQYPEERVSVFALNPRRYPKEGGECKYQRPVRKIRLAWGIKNLLREIPYDKARNIKYAMLAHFGRTKYYRFFREELPLTSTEQAEVKGIFRQNGVDSEPAFARYSEETDW